MYRNLSESQQIWGMVKKVMGKTGVTIKAPKMMYKVVVQVVLMYGSEIWVVANEMMTVLEGLHHRISEQIAGMTERRVRRENKSRTQ